MAVVGVGLSIGGSVDGSIGVLVVSCGGVSVGLLGHVEFCGQSHSFLLSFHSRPAGQGITCGFPDPSGCGTH